VPRAATDPSPKFTAGHIDNVILFINLKHKACQRFQKEGTAWPCSARTAGKVVGVAGLVPQVLFSPVSMGVLFGYRLGILPIRVFSNRIQERSMQLKLVPPIRLTCATVVVISTLFASTTAIAKEYKIKQGHSSGSSVTTQFNFQGDTDEGGVSGADSRTTLSTFQGKDSLGDVHGQIVADYDTVGACPGGAEFKVFLSKGVLNYKKGQLFLEATGASVPNNGCLVFDKWPDYAPASVSLMINYDIVGGSGDYEGANGELLINSSGVLLHNHLHPGDDDQFGSFESDYEGWFEVD